MKPPVDTKTRHVVAQKRLGVGYPIPRRIHRAMLAVWNALPAIGSAIGSGIKITGAIIAVAAVSSCCL
jgi:hypothetical protein